MQAARAASIERFVDRVLLNAKTNLAAGQVPASSGKHVSRREPREAREPLPSIPEQPVQSRGDGVQEFVSRVLDHAAEHVRSSSSSCNGVLKEPGVLPPRPPSQPEPGSPSSPIFALATADTSEEGASLLSSPWPSSLEMSGVVAGALSPIPFRAELSTEDAGPDQTGGEGGEGESLEPDQTAFLSAGESKEHDVTRLPDLEPGCPSEAKASQATVSKGESGEDQDRPEKHVKELEAILETLQSQLQEKDREREHLADALQEARNQAEEQQRVAEEAQNKLREVMTAAADSEDSATGDKAAQGSLQISRSEPTMPSEGVSSVKPRRECGGGQQAAWDLKSIRHPAGEIFIHPSQVLRNQLLGLEKPLQVQVLNPEASSERLRALELRMEETQRQLEVCFERAGGARFPEEPMASTSGPGQAFEAEASPGFSSATSATDDSFTADVWEDKFAACLDLRSCLGNLLDPPELLLKAQAMMRLKAAVGQLYAVLCLQTKARSFLAQKELHRRQRHLFPAGHRTKRPTSAVGTHSQALRRRHTVPQVLPPHLQVSGIIHELDEEASTARLRWSDVHPGPVPRLNLDGLVQFEAVLHAESEATPGPGATQASPKVEVSCGSATFALRKVGQTRPSSSPGVVPLHRASDPPVKPLRRAMSAGGNPGKRVAPARSRPQSHSRKGCLRTRFEEEYVPLAELWLIKNRTMASMMWPPLSEAARGRRPKKKAVCGRCLPLPTHAEEHHGKADG